LDDVPGGVVVRGRVERRRWTGWPLRAAAAVIVVAAGSFAVVRQLADVQPRLAPAPSAAPVVVENQPVASPPPAAKVGPRVKPPVAAQKREAKKDAPPPAPQATAPQAAAPQAAAAPQPTVAAEAQASDVARDSVLAARLESAPRRPVLITGKVVDLKTGEPVSEAQVHLTDSPVSAATNATGDYVLSVPANQAKGQPAKLTVRRLGYESKTDSVTLARAVPDTVHHDVALKESTGALDQVVVTGAGSVDGRPAGIAGAMQAKALRKQASENPSAPGCYTINMPGLPARIEIGDRLRVMPPDSAAFPTAYWQLVATDKVRIVLGDTAGTMHEVKASIVNQGLLGSVTRSDSLSVVTPFSAIRTGARCP